MSRLIDLPLQGAPVMIPLVGLSVATLTCALERGWFWYRLLSKDDLDRAAAIAFHWQ